MSNKPNYKLKDNYLIDKYHIEENDLMRRNHKLKFKKGLRRYLAEIFWRDNSLYIRFKFFKTKCNHSLEIMTHNRIKNILKNIDGVLEERGYLISLMEKRLDELNKILRRKEETIE